MADAPSLAERLEHGVNRCCRNSDDTLLMTYNGANSHNVSTISVGDLRAAAIELRRLEAERRDHLWLLSGSRMTLDGIAEGQEGPTEAAAQAQRIVNHIGHRLTDEPPHTLVENDELRGWKESAMKVLSEWDEVFDALGRPGKLGASKAESALAEVERLIAAGLHTATPREATE